MLHLTSSKRTPLFSATVGTMGMNPSAKTSKSSRYEWIAWITVEG
jgi:hypothetical protein